MNEEHKDRLSDLLLALSEARIIAGAEFEALCNEKDYKSSHMFEMLRDTLYAEMQVVAGYMKMNYMKQGEVEE